MSGHNKWSKIKNQKGEADVEKGKLYTYFARKISLAVKENKGIEQAVEAARGANIPRHIIDKSLKKNDEGKALEELIYEGFLANGKIGLIIVASSENSTRTSNQIRNILDKHAGKFAEPGALNYMFQKQGILYINKSDENEKLILESGASDYFEEENEFRVECEAARLKEIADYFREKNVAINSEEFIYSPIVKVELNENEKRELDICLSSLNLLDEVVAIYHNA